MQLTAIDFNQIVCGDIVLIQRLSGAFVLHRVIKIEEGSFYIVGDAQTKIEGPVFPSQLIAVVCKVKCGDRMFDSKDLTWKLCRKIYRKRSFIHNCLIRIISRFNRISIH